MADPLYLTIKKRLLNMILDGEFPAGTRLPPIRNLAASFDASTKTVQKAIHTLRADGVIESKRGNGLFIKAPRSSLLDRSPRIGVVFAGPPDYLEHKTWPEQVIRPLRESLNKAGFSIVPCPLRDFEPPGIVEQLDRLDLSGIAFFELSSDSLIRDIKQLRLPMISIDYNACHLGISSVVFDNAYGGFVATNFLLSRGHRNVTILHPLITYRVGGNLYLDAVDHSRILGYRIAMQHAGLTIDAQRFYAAGNVKPHLRGLLSKRPAVTGIVCVGDWMAADVLRFVQKQGLSIPQDLSVIGFGDTGVEFAPGRRLSSIRPDAEGMGRQAADMMTKEIREPSELPALEILPIRLADYDSVGMAPGVIEQKAVVGAADFGA